MSLSLFYENKTDLCEELVDLCVNVLCGIAELLVEDLVRSGESEGLETPDGALSLRDEAEKVYRQTCGQTELFDSGREDRLLVLL